tara:strand:- start:1941 stop:2051 length:111 start_codon:yes stop_codon:yes gene_type:complete
MRAPLPDTKSHLRDMCNNRVDDINSQSTLKFGIFAD